MRIQAPVPGEAVVGIEVPNRKREKVYLREILEAEEFAAAQSQLTIALGKDIAGRPMAADLAKMPHLLIAGATGTGKSVSIHTMIASILFNATADDVRFILIDPKMLELSVYENIPHLLVPVVVDPEKAAAALLWATQEMETRYRMMRELGVRNIDGYNRALGAARQGGRAQAGDLSRGRRRPSQNGSTVEPIKHRKLPKIVIVIDELADLLLSEGKTVERDITRLAQKARAVGNPSDSRHAASVGRRDHRAHQGEPAGAHLAAGDLARRLAHDPRFDRRRTAARRGRHAVHAAGQREAAPPARTVRFGDRDSQGGRFSARAGRARLPDGNPRDQGAGEDGGDGGGGERDELYDEAVRIVIETNQASISMIQRRLRIGYNRAARMVEQMEREGLVTPADGMRPREVRSRNAN